MTDTRTKKNDTNTRTQAMYSLETFRANTFRPHNKPTTVDLQHILALTEYPDGFQVRVELPRYSMSTQL